MGCTSSSKKENVDLSEPATLKQFEIQRVVGEGGFGKVNAVNRIGEIPVKWYAMKTLAKVSIVDRKRVREVFQERDLLTHLKHERICNSHYSFQDDKYLYLVMDLALGGDFRFQLKHNAGNKPFDENRTRIYIAQLVLALNYVHSKNVIHRDIKPENLLMNEEGWLKLTDFGISRYLDDKQQCHSGSGTPGYMAPELYEQHHTHGIPSEWFSLGITGYEFLTKSRPFKASEIKTACGSKSFPEIPSIPNVSDACQDFFRTLLDATPSQRLTYNTIRNHPWFETMNWQGIEDGTHEVPFVPNLKRMNAEPDADIHNLFMGGQEQKKLRPLTADEQELFAGYEYDYRYQARLSVFHSKVIGEDEERDNTSDTNADSEA